jgi:hypothetical protein
MWQYHKKFFWNPMKILKLPLTYECIVAQKLFKIIILKCPDFCDKNLPCVYVLKFV